MNRRDRLMATLRGEPVDRPAVSFYELNGLDENPNDPDPFNIYSHPSWRPLLDLTREKTDRIVMRPVAFRGGSPDPLAELTRDETIIRDGRRFTLHTVRIAGRELTGRTRQDPDANTTWTEEHLFKNTDDLEAFLQIPPQETPGIPDTSPILAAEAALGDTGIVMIDFPDPLCLAASLFDMAEYTIIALTEPELFHRLLNRFASELYLKTAAVAEALPGRLWRIYGPEYAAPPYLPPALFQEYVGEYVKPMIDIIHRYGGYARIHSHGRLEVILDHIAAMGADALDPIEPPPQGDVELAYVREEYGDRLVLFGNLEISDIETMPTDRFAERVTQSLKEGTTGSGRGFVLMPSACPYGRMLSPLAQANYEAIIAAVESFN
ncbi:MAG TPA: uroporphyrinogen decarboxylase family protein [Candidatus Sumerlaeota bacterium]|nr:uroporphyrinogen decarboxylase family protein [Candidatus Sumerlaeota bacterium]